MGMEPPLQTNPITQRILTPFPAFLTFSLGLAELQPLLCTPALVLDRLNDQKYFMSLQAAPLPCSLLFSADRAAGIAAMQGRGNQRTSKANAGQGRIWVRILHTEPCSELCCPLSCPGDPAGTALSPSHPQSHRSSQEASQLQLFISELFLAEQSQPTIDPHDAFDSYN